MKISDLTLIEAFVTVARHKSFSRASEVLNLSLPNISKKVQQLESDIGVRLLHRTTRSVSLTTDGTQFFASAEVILKDVEALAANMANSNQLNGDIRIACLPSVAFRWLPDVLLSFQKLHPEVRFELEVSDRLVDLVSERIDIAIRVQEPPKGSDLVYRDLAPNKLVLVATPKYLKEFGAPKSPRDLADHKVLILQAYSDCKFLNERIKLSEIQHHAIKSENGIFLTELALAHAGIAVRSIWDVSKFLKDKSLTQVLSKSKIESFGQLYLVTQAKPLLHRRTVAFVEHIQKHAMHING